MTDFELLPIPIMLLFGCWMQVAPNTTQHKHRNETMEMEQSKAIFDAIEQSIRINSIVHVWLPGIDISELVASMETIINTDIDEIEYTESNKVADVWCTEMETNRLNWRLAITY